MRLYLSLLLLAVPGAGLAAGIADPQPNLAYPMELPPIQHPDISQAALYPRCARFPGHVCAVLQHDAGWRIRIYVDAEPGPAPPIARAWPCPIPTTTRASSCIAR